MMQNKNKTQSTIRTVAGLAMVVALLAVMVALMAPLPRIAQAQAETGSNWQGYYWNNPTFSGSFTASRIDASVNFNWGTSQPIAGIGPNNFSVRWYNTITLQAGTYRFRAGADDGIRVAINNQIIIDRFTSVDSFQVNTTDVTLQAGSYQFIVDYFNGASGPAGVLFDWTTITPGQPTVGPGGVASGGTVTPFWTATPIPVLKAVVIVDQANVRSGPGLNFPTIGQAFLDQILKPVGRNGDFGFDSWYLLDFGGGFRGWMARRVIYLYGGTVDSLPITQEVINAPAISGGQPAQPAAVGPFDVRGVAINNAVVRNAPSRIETQKIGIIPEGGTFQILKLSTTQAWVLVNYNGLIGWTYVPNIRVTVGKFGVLPRGDTQ